MTTLHDFSANTIDGQEKSLADYKGNVVLVVNVASECGLTPQYTGLEALNKEYRGKGLRIVGFPANDFGAQEPGKDGDIKTFCTTHYGVSFDMFSKVAVKGDKKSPIFDWLQSDPKFGGAIKWNFNKFLVGKDGKIIGRFEPPVDPGAPEVRAAIDAALAAP
jgi:glutathione peroxidase